jgi:hypothetical protein
MTTTFDESNAGVGVGFLGDTAFSAFALCPKWSLFAICCRFGIEVDIKTFLRLSGFAGR